MFGILRSLCAGTALLLLAEAAAAHNLEPGSLLIFPEFDNRPGCLTFLTVTNTNRFDDIRVRLVYVDSHGCSRFDAFEWLTPRDTVTAVTKAQASNAERGFVYAYAEDGVASTFDHLIGDSLVIDGVSSMHYSLTPATFRGVPPEGEPTDLNHNGVRDFDGVEYERTPDQIAIPRFFGQTDGSRDGPPFDSELILIGLTGGVQFSTSLYFLIYNDNEESFSANYTFRCWERKRLRDISFIFQNQWLRQYTHTDPREIVGYSGVESGWILIDGSVASSSSWSIADPAFLAVLVETGRVCSASLPFGVGEQSNGGLLPQGLLGTF